MAAADRSGHTCRKQRTVVSVVVTTSTVHLELFWENKCWPDGSILVDFSECYKSD